jgi:hypothetical protein
MYFLQQSNIKKRFLNPATTVMWLL